MLECVDSVRDDLEELVLLVGQIGDENRGPIVDVAEDLLGQLPKGLKASDLVQIAPAGYLLRQSIAEGKELLKEAVREKVRTIG